MDYLDQLERILDGKYRLISMETYDVERVIDLFSRGGRYSSKALYLWTDQEGLRRLGNAHVPMPRTQTPRGVLEQIAASPHFGVYILRDFNDALQETGNQSLLQQIAGTEESAKVVMFLGEQVVLPEALRPLTLRARHQPREAS